MTITHTDSYPRLPWWRRAIRRLCGAQDLVVVVATQMMPNGESLTETRWLLGVDTTQPLAHEYEDGTTVAVVSLAEEPS